MRPVKKTHNPPQSWINKANQRIIEYNQTQTFKKNDIWKDAEFKSYLKEIFNGKCAYCEGKPSSTSYQTADHYRPKSEVIEDEKHPGYYWLAFDHNNLVFCCSRCNIAKSSHFPLKNKNDRVYKPRIPLSCEKPLILNPYTHFNPQEHFGVKDGGIIIGITEEGIKTETMCELNLHDRPSDRQTWWTLIEDKLEEFMDKIELLKRIEKNKLKSDELDLLNNPQKYINSLIKDKYQFIFYLEMRLQQALMKK